MNYTLKYKNRFKSLKDQENIMRMFEMISELNRVEM